MGPVGIGGQSKGVVAHSTELKSAYYFVCRYELKQLDEFLDAGQGNVKDIVEARDRRTDVLATIKDNEKERSKLKVDSGP